MAATLPFAIGLVLGLGAFAAMTYWFVQDARRPVDWAAVDARVAAHESPHLSHTRIAAVCVVFTLRSLWATARPVSGWR